MENKISNVIYALRKSKKLTQEQLAEEMGVSPAAVSKWENAYSIPDISIICILADYFEVTTDELLGRGTSKETLHSMRELTERAAEHIKIAKNILKLAETSRQYGLLALGDALKNLDSKHEFLDFAVNFILKACYNKIPPEQVFDILNNYADSSYCDDVTGYKLIANGMTCILSGESIEYIMEVMCSFLGLSMRTKIISNNTFDYSEDYVSKVIEQYKYKVEYSENTNILNELLDVDDWLIRLIIKRLDNKTFISAMVGASGEIVRKFYMNLNNTLISFLDEDVKAWNGTEVEIVDAQRKIIKIYYELMNQCKCKVNEFSME